jgi:hypothetical protein
VSTSSSTDSPDSRAEEYARHSASKEARVRELLAAHGLEGLFRGLRRCPLERGWRTQASFYLERAGGAARVVGVDPRRGRVPLAEALWVIPDHARGLLVAAAARVAEASADAPITGVDLRLEHGSTRGHLTLAVERGAAARLGAFAEELLRGVPGLLGVAIPSQDVEVGEAYLRHQLLGKTVLSHHRAFFQTNTCLTPALAAAAREAAADPAFIVDLYCGVGLHSVLAAAPESRVYGADNNGRAIESAHRNAALHGLARARYDRVPVERVMEGPGFDAAPSVVYVNPSRWGCAPGLAEAVARWRPAAVCLVSCSIDSHVRDTLAFLAAGYRPLPFGSFDLFPFSDFLESVTVFHPA